MLSDFSLALLWLYAIASTLRWRLSGPGLCGSHEEDKLAFGCGTAFGPVPPQTQAPAPSDPAQQMALQASFAGPWHAAKTSDSFAGAAQRCSPTPTPSNPAYHAKPTDGKTPLAK